MIIENTLDKMIAEQNRLYHKYNKYVKPGRWIYCKYCYGKTRPLIDWEDGLIKCRQCDYGLVPLQNDFYIVLWILGKYWDYIEIKFILHNLKYEIESQSFKKHTKDEIEKGITDGVSHIREINAAVDRWINEHG